MGLETQQAKHLEAQVAKQTSDSTAGHHDSSLGLCSGYGRGIFVESYRAPTVSGPNKGPAILDPCVLTGQEPGDDVIDTGLASAACPVLPMALTAA
jgi:hypothetical protein